MGLINQLKSALRGQSRAQLEEAYLAQSTSQIDLELRQREIDRLVTDEGVLVLLHLRRRHVGDRHEPSPRSRRRTRHGAPSACLRKAVAASLPTKRFSGYRRYWSISS